MSEKRNRGLPSFLSSMPLMHSCLFRFNMLGLCKSLFPGKTIGPSGKVGVAGTDLTFLTDGVLAGDDGFEVSFLKRMVFISLSLAKLNGDFPWAFWRSCLPRLETRCRTVSR